MIRPDYCPCENETPDPCPACGATVKGDDPVNGFCQARFTGKKPDAYGLELILVNKQDIIK